jgi:hypothetical protein
MFGWEQKPETPSSYRNTTGEFPWWVENRFQLSWKPSRNRLTLQALASEIYRTSIEEAVPRPRVIALMDEAFADPSITVGVCSLSLMKEAV